MLLRRIVILVFLFVISSSSFAESLQEDASASNIKQAYLLSTGDQVLIEVYGERDLRKEALLSDSGKISYPFIGEVIIKGLSIAQLEELITRKLKGPFLLNPKVTVSILAYRPFFINGEIDKPGGYPFQPGLTVRKAVALAGGFSTRASKNKIFVIRESNTNKDPVQIDLEDTIHPGDIVTINQSFF